MGECSFWNFRNFPAESLGKITLVFFILTTLNFIEIELQLPFLVRLNCKEVFGGSKKCHCGELKFETSSFPLWEFSLKNLWYSLKFNFENLLFKINQKTSTPLQKNYLHLLGQDQGKT